MAHEADEAQEAPHQAISPTPADAQLGGSFDTGWPAKSLWSAQPRPRPTSQAIPSPSPAVNERELFGGSGGDRPLRGQRPSPRIFPDPNETFKGYSEKEIILKYGPLILGGHDQTPRHEKTPEELWIERMIRRDLRSIEYLKPRAERSTSMSGHYRTAARDAWQRLQENFQWLHAARGHRMTLRPGSWSRAASDPDFTTGHIALTTREPSSNSSRGSSSESSGGSSSDSDSDDQVSTYERLARRARRRIPRLLRHLREMEAHSLTLQGKSTTHGRGLAFPPLSQHGERRIARSLNDARRRIRDAHVEVCRATAEADKRRADASAAAAAAAAATEATDIDAAVASLDVRKHGWDAVPRPSRKRQRRLSEPGEEEKDVIDDNDNGNNDDGEAERTGPRRRAAKAQLKQEIRRLEKSLGMVSPDEGENDVAAAAAADGNVKTKKEELIAEAVIGGPPTSPRRGFPRGGAGYIVEYARDKKKPLWWDSKTDTFLYAGAFPFPLLDLWGKDAAASPGEGGEAEDGEQQKKSQKWKRET